MGDLGAEKLEEEDEEDAEVAENLGGGREEEEEEEERLVGFICSELTTAGMIAVSSCNSVNANAEIFFPCVFLATTIESAAKGPLEAKQFVTCLNRDSPRVTPCSQSKLFTVELLSRAANQKALQSSSYPVQPIRRFRGQAPIPCNQSEAFCNS